MSNEQNKFHEFLDFSSSSRDAQPFMDQPPITALKQSWKDIGISDPLHKFLLDQNLLEPNDLQQNCLSPSIEFNSLVVIAPRGSGRSTTLAISLAHNIIHYSQRKILVVCNQPQTLDFFESTPILQLNHIQGNSNIHFTSLDNISDSPADSDVIIFDLIDPDTNDLTKIKKFFENIQRPSHGIVVFSNVYSTQLREVVSLYIDKATVINTSPEMINTEFDHKVYSCPNSKKMNFVLSILRENQAQNKSTLFIINQWYQVKEMADFLINNDIKNVFYFDKKIGHKDKLSINKALKDGCVIVGTDSSVSSFFNAEISSLINFDLAVSGDLFIKRLSKVVNNNSKAQVITLICEDYGVGLENINRSLSPELRIKGTAQINGEYADCSLKTEKPRFKDRKRDDKFKNSRGSGSKSNNESNSSEKPYRNNGKFDRNKSSGRDSARGSGSPERRADSPERSANRKPAYNNDHKQSNRQNNDFDSRYKKGKIGSVDNIKLREMSKSPDKLADISTKSKKSIFDKIKSWFK